MLQIFQSDKLYVIFISLRFIISTLLLIPYIKNLIHDTYSIKIFTSTIFDYITMSFLATLSAISIGNKFSIIGYVKGIILSIIIISSLICLVFVCSNEICKINISESEKYKNKIRNIISESTTVMSILTILLTSIVINNISNYRDNKVLNTSIFVLLAIKIIGHYYTKMGDIISDFKEKIINQNKEDNSLDEYSKIDNIGDIFGDCCGEVISFIILTCFLFKFTVLETQITHTYGSYLDKSYIICIIMYILSIKNRKSCKLGYIVLSIVLIINLIDPIIKYFAYHGYNITDIIRYIYYNFITQLYILIPTLIILFSFNKIIKIVTSYLYNRSISIPICGLIENISISLLLSFSIITMTILSIKITNKYLFISHLAIFEIFSICGCVCLYNTIFSTFADSINGIIKKKNLKLNKTLDKYDQITEEYLEELDNNGNILKLESKVLMCLFAQTLILIKSGITNFKIRINDLYIFLIFITILTTFSSIIYKTYIEDSNTKKYMYELPFYTFIVLITGHIGISILFSISKTYGISVLMLLLLISNFSNISGSIFDCIKKKAEINNYKEKNLENYKIIVQNDMIGDFLKDVLGPTLFGISISCLIYI